MKGFACFSLRENENGFQSTGTFYERNNDVSETKKYANGNLYWPVTRNIHGCREIFLTGRG